MEEIFKLIISDKNDKIDEIILNIEKNDLNINLRDKNNTYLIEYAINYNNIKLIDFLLKKNTKIDFINNEGRSIFYNITKYYNNILKLIYDYVKTNPSVIIYNITDNYKNIPLHYSIIFNNIFAFELFIDKSNVNFCDIENNNSLYYAIINKNLFMVNYICNNFIINYDNINNNGDSILHIACDTDFTDIELLLKKGCNVDILQYNTKASCLLYSILLNKDKISDILLKYHADINLQDNIGNTCFHYAVKNNNYIFINKYIDKLINMNILNINNESILHRIY
jgi:ankyrin repeat protein